jgi:SAM-dependent methyltransferase
MKEGEFMDSTQQADSNALESRFHSVEDPAWWDFWNTSYRAEEGADQNSAELFDIVASLVTRIGPGDHLPDILEIACGTGALSRQLRFASYHGIDLSPAAVSIAVDKAKAKNDAGAVFPATYEAADFLAWSAAPQLTLDLILIVDAICCMHEPGAVLKKSAQLLKSGGACILTSVNPVVYRRIRRPPSLGLQKGPTSQWLSRGELVNLVRNAQLIPERAYSIMPKGNAGFLRLINSRKLNHMFGPAAAQQFRLWKEACGLGQYNVVICRKP